MSLLLVPTCILRIDKSRYIVVVHNYEDDLVAVVGELSHKNDYNSYNSKIYNASDFAIVPLVEIYDKSELTLELLLEKAKKQMGDRFPHFMREIRCGSSE
ncbi:uncharacterized protein RJT20DRAFT_128309 [Scheffersomyces xylosifermentans]|uniref:uncharacterized protein n=1 Tax=Scheffersomyces xylosifermentans TaxID=1304137 RepID=UPI00315D30D6